MKSITSPLHGLRKELKSRQPQKRYDEDAIIGVYLCPSDQYHYEITKVDRVSGKKPIVIGQRINCPECVTAGVVRMYLDEWEKQVRFGTFKKVDPNTFRTPDHDR